MLRTIPGTTDRRIDALLALLLLVGGVVGAQLGTRFGARLRGEQLRALLAIMVLVEINAVTGTPGKGAAKPLATVKGTLWFGFLLTLVYYVWFMIMQ